MEELNMKKFLVVLVILAVVITGVFAETTLDDKTITIYGIIRSGDPLLGVTQEITEAEPIDLTDKDLVPGSGAGIRVGSWNFTVANQTAGTKYFIEYIPNAFTSTTVVGVTYEFEVIELDLNVDGYTSENDGTGGEIELSGTSLDIEEVGLAIRLTGSGVSPEAVPGSFTGSIKINLITND
jgi:hypothetical protein